MEKSKAHYSLWSNIVYALGVYWNARKSMIIWSAVGIIMGVLLPFAGILMPKLVIDELTAKVTPEHFCTVVGGMALLMVLLSFLKHYSDSIINDNFGMVGCVVFGLRFNNKLINMDYELLENPSVKQLEDKALKAGQSNHTPAMNLPCTLALLTVNLIGFFLYGSVITSIHPIILLLLILSAVINWIMLSHSRKYEKDTYEYRAKIDRKLGYLNSVLINPDMAKDIRLYSMFDWLHGLSEMHFREKERAEYGVATRDMLAKLTDGLIILIRDSAAYAFLIYLLIQGRISLGNFVLLFAAIGTFASWVSGIILQTSELFRSSSEMSDLRSFIDLPDKSNTGKGAELPDQSSAPGISFENVGYSYPNSDKPALQNINVNIKPGERIAIVGANGAGKTTFVKLLCGLYQPTEGHITLNDIDIKEYNRDEYFSLFSVVFQDIHLMTNDIAQNISQQTPEKTDYMKVNQCLRLSGLYDKVQSLPQKEKTLLVKQVNDEAAELSGGEKQKLALARAIYKNGPVIILDEPTAALDPIAENEIYQKYAELTEGKTSIYISHRLASTRFCDRILFLDEHTIVEEGTHEELIKYGGRYAEMFSIQASYYADKQEVQING